MDLGVIVGMDMMDILWDLVEYEMGFLLLKDRPFTFCLFLFVGLSLVDDG